MDVGTLVSAGVGLAVGFVLQASTGWITDYRRNKRDDAVWRREQQVERFSAFFAAVQDAMYLIKRDDPGHYAALNVAYVNLNMVMPESLGETMSALFRQTRDLNAMATDLIASSAKPATNPKVNEMAKGVVDKLNEAISAVNVYFGFRKDGTVESTSHLG